MVFELKSPLLGFENIDKMKLEQIDDLFYKLTKESGEQPTFILVNPFSIREYEIDIPNNIKELLHITKHEQVMVYNIMITKQPIENSTINFAAPIIFNVETKEMAQIILDSNRYPQYGLIEKISDFAK
jgi:flagellar assembly factor FliW